MEKVRIKRTNKQFQVTSWFKPNSNNKKTQRKRPKGKKKTSQPLVNYEVSWESTSTVTCSEHFTFATQLLTPDALRLKQSIVKMKSKQFRKAHSEHTKVSRSFTSPALLDALHKARSADPLGPVQGWEWHLWRNWVINSCCIPCKSLWKHTS